MKRDIAQLATKHYDLLVVGAGIHGACVAWDAALRGLSVALVDKGDFGHATSSNSLKIVHGGLRYLQDADLKLARTMVHERQALMRIAPHLVHPLPCIMPTYRQSRLRGKFIMAAAMLANDLVAFDRNRLDDPQKRLRPSHVISRDTCLRLLPGVKAEGLTGGAVWYDAQMYNSERLLLSFVLSASKVGASVANYVDVTGLLKKGECIYGAIAKDVLTGEQFDIRAKLVVNAAGAWAYDLLSGAVAQSNRGSSVSTAINLITRQLVPKYAAGITSADQATGVSHLLFMVPWHGHSLIGTIHSHFEGCPDGYRPRAQEVESFVNEINRAYPGASLELKDVQLVHRGFLPAEPKDANTRVRLIRRGRVIDHSQTDGLNGLITLLGVKYTTAREVAQRAVDLVVEKLGKSTPVCSTHVTPLYGGQITHFKPFLEGAVKTRREGQSAQDMEHLVYNYGSEYRQVLAQADEDPALIEKVSPAAPVMKAQVAHAVRSEMANKLGDVVFRRTELGSTGHPGDEALEGCAATMAHLMGWSDARKEQELEEVKAAFLTYV